jgi:very-short-patch-repair endonuclease
VIMPSTWKSNREKWIHNKELARNNRANMSMPEVIIWHNLRGGSFCGEKFRRQQSIGPYIVDFYCHRLNLIIEVDGWSHLETEKKDKLREEYFNSHGLQVYHVDNEKILHYTDEVINELEALVLELKLTNN